MIKSAWLTIVFSCAAFLSFCQDIEKLSKKELRGFSNQKNQEVDSLNLIITKERNIFLNEVNLNKRLSVTIDSILLILKEEKQKTDNGNSIIDKLNVRLNLIEAQIKNFKEKYEIANKDKLILKNKLDSLTIVIDKSTFNSFSDFYKKIPALNHAEEFNHRDLTYIHPIGWSLDGKYFAYFTDFGSGAQYFDFRIDQVDNIGVTKNVSIITCEMDCDIDNFLVSQNDNLRKEIFKYGINKIEDTILKNNIILAKDKGLKLNIIKIIRGTCNDMLAQRDFPKIKSLDINLKDIYNKIVNNYNLDLSDQCDFDFQNIGYIESPNKKNLIFLIEHWGVNGYEGYPAVKIDLISFPSYK